MINYKQLVGKVEECLQKDEQSRNSDIRLYNYLLLHFPIYKEKLVVDNFNNYSIPLKARYELPKEEDVVRIRRKFNEKGLYLATDEVIINERKKRSKEWREQMSPSNPSRG